MKTNLLLFIVCMLLIPSGSIVRAELTAENGDSPQESLKIVCTPDLIPLARVWTQEYNNLDPAYQAEVSEAAPGSFITPSDGGIGLMTASSVVTAEHTPGWKMVLGRSILVPVIHKDNPFNAEINARGISPASLASAIKDGGESTWGTLLSGDQTAPVQLFMQDGEEIRSLVEGFLNEKGISFTRIRTGSAEDVIRWVQEDPLAIGFCNAVYVQGTEELGLQAGLRLLPIDKNGNGQIDPVEDIYADFAQFQRGVWIGKYPRALYDNIYVVSTVQPADDASQAFLKWAMTEGQRYMIPNAYCGLVSIESQSNLSRIKPTDLLATEENKAASLPLILSVILILGIAAGVGIRAFVRSGAPKMELAAGVYDHTPRPLDESAIEVPEGLYYDNTHTWAFMEKNGLVSIGLDDFMQHIVGSITRIQMKNPGESVKKGELLFSIIQSGKQLNIYSPLSGIIRKQNEILKERSSAVNTSPYSEGWVYQIEPSNWVKEVQVLRMAEKFRNSLSAEFTRVKDVLAASLKPGKLELAYVNLQDGGALKDGVLADLGPEVWADFQSSFLDNPK